VTIYPKNLTIRLKKPMQYDNKNLLDFGIVIGIELFKLGENRNNETQNRNNGVLEISMALFCLYNKTRHELTHADLSHVLSVT